MQLRTNYRRRAFGVMLGAAPFVLLAASAVYGMAYEQPSFRRELWVAVTAMLIGTINFYLSYIRPGVYRILHGSFEDYRHVSGIPIVGTILVCFAGLFTFGNVGTAIIGLCALMIDTGGWPWFMIWTWRDKSFWDA